MQVGAARVRRDTGAGLLTGLVVDPDQAEPAAVPRVIGDGLARVEGLRRPLPSLVIEREGHLATPEEAAFVDDTADADLGRAGLR